MSDPSQRLAELHAEAAREYAARVARRETPTHPTRAPSRPPWAKLTRRALAVLLLLAFPFLLLVRGSVFLYARHHYPTWLALLVAALTTGLVVTAYAAWLSRRLTGRARVALVGRWVAAPLVVGFCGHALLFLSRSHAKQDAVQTEYRAAHPLLRIALSTMLLADGDLVVTDLRRVPGDYAAMGLPVFRETLHAVQRDGWAHAVDLRTIGHNELVNRLVEIWFRAMGFRTLRHVGTADHLHVELPLP
jgi:hypothetical protein